MKHKKMIGLLVVLAMMACVREKDVLTRNLQICYSVCPYQDGLLISNWGTDSINPLNQEGKGYIAFHKEGVTSILIPADGTLSAPKGMAVKDDYLFVADVNKVVVYNLNETSDQPQVISFPEGNDFVSDVAIIGNVLLAAVTNTSSIYALDISNLAHINVGSLAVYAVVPGATSLCVSDYHLFIGSSTTYGEPTEFNVIYMIDDLSNPVAQPITHRIGQYQDLALTPDGESLYFIDKNSKELGRLEFATGVVDFIAVPMKWQSPSSLVWWNDQFVIADRSMSTIWLSKF
ncbi:MAG: hypothetical protein PHI42_02480 [Paludibacteraceae bacterium]|nr:hypothetical protein [Paludibacteraceae bacterium]